MAVEPFREYQPLNLIKVYALGSDMWSNKDAGWWSNMNFIQYFDAKHFKADTLSELQPTGDGEPQEHQ